MGEANYTKNINRFQCPIKLNPKEATFDDVAIHAILRQRLSESTVKKNLRYARFMEKHEVPVDFRNPDYENFIRHTDYREQVENVGFGALKAEWQTMRMFLRAYGIPTWDYKLPYAPKPQKRILPFPDIVNKFFHYEYSKDNYENTLFQYIFFHSFMIGWRTPSEIIEMTVDDVILDSSGRGCITITETKKHRQKRTILPEKSILSSRVHKSFKNWLDVWRPRVENQYSGDSLYLQASGKPFIIAHFRNKLSKFGKKIWKPFQPYDMRHWCAIARLIKTKRENGTFDVLTVRNWLGHTDIKTTQNYIHHADMYYNQAPIDWISNAIKPQKGGKKKS